MIKWANESRKLSDLKAYELHPRRITEKGLNDLIKSRELFGLAIKRSAATMQTGF